MTERQLRAAYKLYEAAKEYREAYEEENGAQPTIWLRNDLEGNGETIFIADGFNSQLINEALAL